MSQEAEETRHLEAHALGDASLLGGVVAQPAPRAVKLTDNWNATAKARAVPESYWDPGHGAWMLPLDCEDSTARIALRLFPLLFSTCPALVARAEVQNVAPVNNSVDAWVDRPMHKDSWGRVLAAAPMTPHLYQRQDSQFAIDALNRCGGAYLGAEPGLGKTLMACMVADGWGANFVLVVCPNSAKHRTWERAGELVPWLGAPIVIGNSKAQREGALAEAAERMDAGTPTLVICHYEALGLVDWAPLGTLDLVIADEAHRLKNSKAKFVVAFTKIKTCGTLLLSGSVLDGDVEDLWVPMRAMQPKRYSAKWRTWNDRFVDYAEGDFGKISLGARPHRIPELRSELGEVLVVRRAADELDIPTPHTERVSLALLPVQRRAYDSLVEDLFAELPDGDIITAQQGAGLISKLRGVTGGVPLPDEGYASSKLDYIEELLDLKGAALGVGGRPLQSVVFFWHKEPANRLAARLGPLAAVVHGDVPNKLREERVEAFAQGQVRVLIATFATLSESVNLQMAGRVILGEHSWKPLHNDQAIDRVVRQGQTAHASVVHVTAADTVDELRVLPVIKSKTMLRQLVLGR